MLNTNPTTNALEEYAPFDKGYVFAYWSKRLNRFSWKGKYLGFKYKKTVSLPYMDIQISEILREHKSYVHGIKDPIKGAAILIAACIRFEGEEANVEDILSMPTEFIYDVFSALKS